MRHGCVPEAPGYPAVNEQEQCRWTEYAMVLAAQVGDGLALHAEMACSVAAHGGNLDVLQWLRS